MKTRTIFIMMATFAIAFISCDKVITPSGNVTQESHAITGFTSIDISDAFTANVTFTPIMEGVIIEADDNIHQYIDIKKVGNRLYIGIERNYNISGPATLNALISTSDEITGLYASSASLMSLTDQLIVNNLRIEASGASRIVGSLDVNSLSADLSGASNFELDGSADDAAAKLSGASTLGGYDLVIQDLEIQLSGASNSRTTVDGTLDVNASGASSVLYKGDGVVTYQNLSGASQIVQVD